MIQIKCTKNYANWFRHFEDVGSQSWWSNFLAHPVYVLHVYFMYTVVFCHQSNKRK